MKIICIQYVGFETLEVIEDWVDRCFHSFQVINKKIPILLDWLIQL